MRIILLLCLFCFDFNELIAFEIVPRETRSKEIRPISRNKTNFIDLIYDIQLLIFEQLDVIDLVSLAETTKQLTSIVEHVWKRKNGKKTLIFVPYRLDKIQESDDQIEVDNPQNAEKVLNNFGHLISSIMINYHQHYESSTEILRLVNVYCSESLVKFHIEHYEYDFSEFKKPFTKIDEISLKGEFNSVRSPYISFNEVFPTLRILRWNLVKTNRLNIRNEQMKHLEEISGEVLNYSDGKPIKALIKNHPYLRIINLKIYNKNFLEYIANEIACIHNLEKFQMDLRQDEIWFDFRFDSNNTKRFSATGDIIFHLLSNNSFGKIHDIEIRSFFNAYGPTAVQFLPVHRDSVKRFRTHTKLSNGDIMHLARAEMIFSELEIKLDFDVTVNSIIQLIEKSRFLMEANLFTFDANGIVYFKEFNALKERLPAGWIAEEKQIFRSGYIHLYREFGNNDEPDSEIDNN